MDGCFIDWGVVKTILDAGQNMAQILEGYLLYLLYFMLEKPEADMNLKILINNAD